MNTLKSEANDDLQRLHRQIESTRSELDRIDLDMRLQSDEVWTSKNERLTQVMNDLSEKSRELNQVRRKLRAEQDVLHSTDQELQTKNSELQQVRHHLLENEQSLTKVQQELRTARSDLRAMNMEINKMRDEQQEDRKFRMSRDIENLRAGVEEHRRKYHETEQALGLKKKDLETVGSFF